MSYALLLSLCFSSIFAIPASRYLLPRVLDGVRREINFFASDYSNINVDGLFGLRVGQGQIIEALRECDSRQCPQDLVDALDQFTRILDTVSKRAMPYLERASPDYYARFYDTIAKPYILKYRPTTFGDLDNVQVGTKEAYSEEEGDSCYARVLGTYKEGESLLPKCNTTRPCIDLMTQENTKRYLITHQLLYFIVIEHTGCSDELNKEMVSFGNTGIRETEDKLCRSIVKEASLLAEGGSVIAGSQDLFLEESVLCGALGYEDILKPQYISMVLRMQSKDGCFKWMPDLGTGDGKTSGRKLLREQTMSDGCLSHKSGLGFGTLGVYLRYLIRQLF